MKDIVKVAVESLTYSADKLYDYKVPEELIGKISIGTRVLVPFGFGNKKRQAIVLGLDDVSQTKKLKTVWAVLDEAPLLNSEMIGLAYKMKRLYYCTLFEAVKSMLPSGLSVRIQDNYEVNNEVLNLKYSELNNQEKTVIDYLKSKEHPISEERILSHIKFLSADVLKNLVLKGFLNKEENYKRKTLDAKIKRLRLKNNYDEKRLTTKQSLVCEFLREKGAQSIKEINYFTGVSNSVINGLIKKDVVETFEEEVYRSPGSNYSKIQVKDEINLTDEQNIAYQSLFKQYKANKYSVSLLYGITGSGKTSVFMKLIDKVYEDGKKIIVMVPEIALTPQLTLLFKSRYGDEVAIFHSNLSSGERLDEFKRAKQGKIKIAVGTRSAIFAPLEDIGLIIMDEEHEHTYKSESNPRFHARDLAKLRCRYHNALLLLCSATPSIESYYMAENKRYTLNKLTNRYGGAILPKVTVIDMNNEIECGNVDTFSRELISKLANNIKNKKQSILLMNRRGYNTYVRCGKCSEVITCKNCSISMTYHAANNKMMCHYCGYSTELPEVCPACNEKALRFSGTGTQKVEDELEKLLPEARILRMDTDTTSSRFSHEEKLRAFKDGKYDIMIGTQMVAKGLNFPNVTLVGIINADQALYGDDFRSYEKAFALMTQVIGRSGRYKDRGEAIIQTYTPDNAVIQMAANQDYEEFYKEEKEIRKIMLYPPFVSICVAVFCSKNREKSLSASKHFFENLKTLISKKYKNLPIRVLGPSEATVLKVDNLYRHKIIIKFKESTDFRNMIEELLLIMSSNKEYSSVGIFIDVNPDRIL